jgi:lipoate-protein ligase A
VSKRNSLFIGNNKFSGHAEHIFRNKVLHHGTLLFDTDLEALQKSLIPGKEYSGKAMASVRSDVCNLAPLLSKSIDIHQFIQNLIVWLRNFYPESKSYQLSEHELNAISELTEIKYKTWMWNFGYSPAYTFQANIPIANRFISIKTKVENGKFAHIDFHSDNENPRLTELFNSMTGLLHKEEEIDRFVEENSHLFELVGINTVLFTRAFFS